jgi:hypothetical protein
MRKMFFAMVIIFLISVLSFAQTFDWQEISKPYFVNNIIAIL